MFDASSSVFIFGLGVVSGGCRLSTMMTGSSSTVTSKSWETLLHTKACDKVALNTYYLLNHLILHVISGNVSCDDFLISF